MPIDFPCNPPWLGRVPTAWAALSNSKKSRGNGCEGEDSKWSQQVV